MDCCKIDSLVSIFSKNRFSCFDSESIRESIFLGKSNIPKANVNFTKLLLLFLFQCPIYNLNRLPICAQPKSGLYRVEYDVDKYLHFLFVN